MTHTMPLIDVYGDAFQVGRACALETLHLRGLIAENILKVHENFDPTQTATQIKQITEVLEQYSPDTLGQMAGMAEVYELDRSDMLVAVLQTYFDGLRREELGADQGCTVYGYASAAGSVLVKNRDAALRFLNAQTVLRVSAQGSYVWTALSTAGAPGVHSAGMNETGLSVADTHVPSRDSGPGLPRFSMMMNILQRCATVAEALEYYQATPSMGYGNLILQDVAGETAVIECGFQRSAVRTSEAKYIAATNHFTASEMRDSGLEDPQSVPGLDTRKRRALLAEQLDDLGEIVLGAPMKPMSRHEGGGIGSICVHEEPSPTISTIVMRPQQKVLEIAHGNPCEAEVTRYSVVHSPGEKKYS